MNIKIEEKDFKMINRVSVLRGEGTSDFVRMAIRKELARLGFLSNNQVKALEVRQD